SSSANVNGIASLPPFAAAACLACSNTSAAKAAKYGASEPCGRSSPIRYTEPDPAANSRQSNPSPGAGHAAAAITGSDIHDNAAAAEAVMPFSWVSSAASIAASSCAQPGAASGDDSAAIASGAAGSRTHTAASAMSAPATAAAW